MGATMQGRLRQAAQAYTVHTRSIGLQRLFLTDIRAGQVDVVVVYKIDQLTHLTG